MAENLAFIGQLNQSVIDLVTTPEKWISLNSPGYCWYDNDKSKYEEYGVLYNWYAANTESICPEGWRVPTDADWMELERFLGMAQQEVEAEGIRGEVIGGKIKESGVEHWNPPNFDANNMSGFTALPEGHRNGGSGQFVDIRSFGTWWTKSEKDDAYAWRRTVHYNDSKIRRFVSHKRDGFSVRCIKK